MKPSEVLAKAADLIEPEGAWTQGYLARTFKGVPTAYNSPDAACWCGMGAINRVVGKAAPERENAFELFRDYAGVGLPTFNDRLGRTQAVVVAALRAASAKGAEAGQ